MSYVDGFVLAVPKARLDDYKKMAGTAGAIWKEHGALAYVECVGDDVPYGELTSFPRAVQATDDRVQIKQYRDDPTATMTIHAFYVKHLLPIWFDVQSMERHDGAPLPGWTYQPTAVPG